MKKTFSAILLCLAILLPLGLLAACTEPTSAFADDGRLKITATLFPQYDFARVIGGDRVQVIKLLPSGTESHTYEPTATDILTVADSDLFLYTGADMEPWAQTVLSGIDQPPMAIDLSEGIQAVATDHDHEHDHDEDGTEDDHVHAVSDPHIWTSPKNAMIMVEAICDALIELDPAGEATYRANTDAYLQSLDAMHTELCTLSADHAGETLVFGGRFAFAHLCAAYGFSYISAYRGCDVEAEPSASDITAVIEFIRAADVSYFFREELVAPQSVATIAAETGAKPLLLHSCHNVTQEDLAKDVSFLSLMQQNIENIRLALTA